MQTILIHVLKTFGGLKVPKSDTDCAHLPRIPHGLLNLCIMVIAIVS